MRGCSDASCLLLRLSFFTSTDLALAKALALALALALGAMTATKLRAHSLHTLRLAAHSRQNSYRFSGDQTLPLVHYLTVITHRTESLTTYCMHCADKSGENKKKKMTNTMPLKTFPYASWILGPPQCENKLSMASPQKPLASPLRVAKSQGFQQTILPLGGQGSSCESPHIPGLSLQ